MLTPEKLLEPFPGEGKTVSVQNIVRHCYGTEIRDRLRLGLCSGPMATISVTGVFATRNIASGRPRELDRSPVTSAPCERLSAPSREEFRFSTEKFGVPQEREKGRTRGCG